MDPLDTENGTRLSSFDEPVIPKKGPTPTVCPSRPHILQPKRPRQQFTTESFASQTEKPIDQVLAHGRGFGCGLVLSVYS